MFDKAKAAVQLFKLKKEIEGQIYEIEENGVKVVVAGFMAMSEPKIKILSINGVENRTLTEAVNKALKKSTEASLKKMQELGKGLEGAM